MQAPTTAAECGSADAYYSGGRWYGYKPHCYRDGRYVPDCDMTGAELRQYRDAFFAEDDRKDWGR